MTYGLQRCKLELTPHNATFYLFVRIPPGTNSLDFTSQLLDKAGLVVTPGVGFGEQGVGFIRMALTGPDQRMHEAVLRLTRFFES